MDADPVGPVQENNIMSGYGPRERGGGMNGGGKEREGRGKGERGVEKRRKRKGKSQLVGAEREGAWIGSIIRVLKGGEMRFKVMSREAGDWQSRSKYSNLACYGLHRGIVPLKESTPVNMLEY